MPLYAIARTAKQKGGSVASSGHHNDRTRETLNADPDRRDQNQLLIGDDRNVRERVMEVIQEHGGKPRSDSVEAVEMMLTATHDFFTDEHDEIDEKKVKKFVDQAKAFLRDPRSGGICVKAVLHLDERTPHVQAHKVPIDPQGKLNCKHYFGGRAKMAAFQDLYHSYMAPLGLERGERGSQARHIDIQKYYGAITQEHQLKLSADRLPDPPLIRTEKAVKKYKQEIIKAVDEQVREPLKTLFHQAMLTREHESKREAAELRAEQRIAAAEKRADERIAAAERTTGMAMSRYDAEFKENVELRGRVGRLEQTVTTLRSELTSQRDKTAEMTRVADERGDRLRDIPLPDVMEKLGYGREQVQDAFVYRTDQGQIALFIRDGQLHDYQSRVLCRNSVDLVLHMQNVNKGENITRTDAINWLADNFGEERALAAYVVEREQVLGSHLTGRRQERELATQQRLTPAEHTPEIQMPERDMDLGFSR